MSNAVRHDTRQKFAALEGLGLGRTLARLGQVRHPLSQFQEGRSEALGDETSKRIGCKDPARRFALYTPLKVHR